MKDSNRMAKYWNRLYRVPCHKCKREIDLASQAASVPSDRQAWRLDTRQVIVRCPKCHTFGKAFVYPLFNWVPPARAVAEVALLNVASLLLVMGATIR